jgi:pimeloyl-ACP methyl ester carboxylesterase
VPAIADLAVDHVTPALRAHSRSLLFVHGMWGGSWVFHNYLAYAASHGWEAWALNLRGHHGSRPVRHLATVRLEDYVRDVEDVLDTIGPAVVIGHSMGGLLAQIVASRRDVEAAVLIASAPPPGIALAHWALAWRSLRYLADVFGPRAFRVREADACALALNAMAPAARRRVAERFVEDSGFAARQLALGAVDVPKAIRCPVLVVSPSDDRLIPAGVQRRIAERYLADYLCVDGRGHMLPIESDWREAIAGILAWLVRIDRTRPGIDVSCTGCARPRSCCSSPTSSTAPPPSSPASPSMAFRRRRWRSSGSSWRLSCWSRWPGGSGCPGGAALECSGWAPSASRSPSR